MGSGTTVGRLRITWEPRWKQRDRISITTCSRCSIHLFKSRSSIDSERSNWQISLGKSKSSFCWLISQVTLISGKGPQKAFYQGLLSQKKFGVVKVCLPWLESGDYPLMLGKPAIVLSASKWNLDNVIDSPSREPWLRHIHRTGNKHTSRQDK